MSQAMALVTNRRRKNKRQFPASTRRKMKENGKDIRRKSKHLNASDGVSFFFCGCQTDVRAGTDCQCKPVLFREMDEEAMETYLATLSRN
jgi:hypothetical protein